MSWHHALRLNQLTQNKGGQRNFQAAQPRAKLLFHVSQPKCGEPNPLKRTQNDPCPPRAPGGAAAQTGIQMRALYAVMCSVLLYAAPPMTPDHWTPTLIISEEESLVSGQR